MASSKRSALHLERSAPKLARKAAGMPANKARAASMKIKAASRLSTRTSLIGATIYLPERKPGPLARKLLKALDA